MVSFAQKVLATVIVLTSQGAWGVTFLGAGGPIPDATLAGPGVFTSDITAPGDTMFVAPGNAVTVGLLGLQHTFAGDLIATLKYKDLLGNVLVTQDLFNRIGKLSADPTDLGSDAQFGDGFGNGDNYHFNTDFAGDIWTAAANAGTSNPIPGESNDLVNFGQYWTTTAFTSTRTNFSYSFTGLPVNGTWELVISDNSPGDTGSLVQWSLTISEVAVPEPEYNWLSAVLAGAMILAARGKNRFLRNCEKNRLGHR